VLGRRRQILDAIPFPAGIKAQRTRIHGDYHLGQVLRAKTNYVILRFEGDPARPLAERRAKHSPLKDVASMLRSFGYAAQVSLMNYTARRPEEVARLEPWARLWERYSVAEFLRCYRETAGDAEFLPADKGGFRSLLTIYLLERALQDLTYELDSRPNWARIPLIGILSLPLEAGGHEWNRTSFPSRR
jgi:maltose alpha-D-glucosyltransferase/alpha-amylase